MHLFDDARQQLRAAMSDGSGRLLPGARVVQVGDLGGYKHGPGETPRGGGEGGAGEGPREPKECLADAAHCRQGPSVHAM